MNIKIYRLAVLLSVLAAIIVLGLICFLDLTRDLPSTDPGAMHFYTPGIRITDRNDRLLYEVLADGKGRHNLLAYNEIPDLLVKATVATEDRSFFQNPGVDLTGILRAVWINGLVGETRAGGSTITQQVAKNLLLSAEERNQQTMRRKLREAYLALRITLAYSKEEIISIYINQTYYGEMAYGVDAASRTYFGRPVSELDLAEIALLAGIPQAPSFYDPLVHPDKAKERQAVVLRLMAEQGIISQTERQMAEREPLIFSAAPYPMEAPHFVVMVLNQYDALSARCGFPPGPGAIVRTTLDLNAQTLAEEGVRRQIEELKRNPQQSLPGEGAVDHNVSNGALVTMNPINGDVLALVGSADYREESIRGAVNMAAALRQPGSTLKPFIYAAAFDPSRDHHGQRPWNAATMILDVKTNFLTHEGQPYTPANYDNQEHGPVLARQALASSLNIPAVKTLQFIGMDALFQTLNALGVPSLGNPEQYDLSLALGGGEISLVDLTAAYAAFANGGWQISPRLILDVREQDGTFLYSSASIAGGSSAQGCPPERRGQARVYDEKIAWLITDILADDNARLLGFGRHSALELDRPAAVKTGTTSNFHDNWTIGYTPDLVTGVWVGNTDNQPMRNVSGLTGAGPIWHEFMRSYLNNRPEKSFHRPEGLVHQEVCALSGLLPTQECPYRLTEWFLPGTIPTAADNLYRRVSVDARTNRLAGPQTPPSAVVQRTVLDLPSSAGPWAREQGLVVYSDLLSDAHPAGPAAPPAAGSSLVPAVNILSPRPNAVYRMVSGQAELQRLPIQVNLNLPQNLLSSVVSVTVHIDGAPVPVAAPDYQTWWKLIPGPHTLQAEVRFAAGLPLTSERIRIQVNP